MLGEVLGQYLQERVLRGDITAAAGLQAQPAVVSLHQQPEPVVLDFVLSSSAGETQTHVE